MIPIQADREKPTVVGSMVSSTEFKMRASGKAFKLFSSSLYTNKIAAIIRELSTNAVDAQKENGREFVPIEVTLPTDLDPTLTIADSGCGMTTEVLTTIYSTVFESTKTDSNDFNGEMGLGSKSPIFYADTMSVVSVSEGQKTIAVVYLNDQTIPCIDVVSSQPTNEPAGTIISLGVKSDDIERFHEETVNIYKYFTVLPKINNLYDRYRAQLEAHHESITKAKKEGIKLPNGVTAVLRPDTPNGADAIIIQSGVGYPVNQRRMSRKPFDNILRTSPLSYIFNNSGIDLYVPNGTVAFGPSREEIEYIEHNELFITEILEQLSEAVEKFYTDKIRSCSTADELIDLFIEHNVPTHRSSMRNSIFRLWYSLDDVPVTIEDIKDKVVAISDKIGDGAVHGTDYSGWRNKGNSTRIENIFAGGRSFLDASYFLSDPTTLVEALMNYRKIGVRSFIRGFDSKAGVVWMDSRFSKPDVARYLRRLLKFDEIVILEPKSSTEYAELKRVESLDDDVKWVFKLSELIAEHKIDPTDLRSSRSSTGSSTLNAASIRVQKQMNESPHSKFILVVRNQQTSDWRLTKPSHDDLDELSIVAARKLVENKQIGNIGVIQIPYVTWYRSFIKSKFAKGLIEKGILVTFAGLDMKEKLKSAYRDLTSIDIDKVATRSAVNQLPYAIRQHIRITYSGPTLYSASITEALDTIPAHYRTRLTQLHQEIDNQIESLVGEKLQRFGDLQDSYFVDRWIDKVIQDAVKAKLDLVLDESSEQS